MDEQKHEGRLADEFRQLGKNLTGAMRAAWDSPERKRLQEEIYNGLNELGTTLREESQHIKDSPTGQRIRSEAEEARNRFRSGEVEARAREDLLTALHLANEQLRKVIDFLSDAEGKRGGQPRPTDRPAPGGEPNPGTRTEDVESTPMQDTGPREVHPDDVEADLDQGSGHQEIHPDDVESNPDRGV